MTGANGVAEWRQLVSARIAHQHDARQSQGALEHEDDVGFGHRSRRDQTDAALHARVDRIAKAENVAEYHFATVATGVFSKFRS